MTLKAKNKNKLISIFIFAIGSLILVVIFGYIVVFGSSFLSFTNDCNQKFEQSKQKNTPSIELLNNTQLVQDQPIAPAKISTSKECIDTTPSYTASTVYVINLDAKTTSEFVANSMNNQGLKIVGSPSYSSDECGNAWGRVTYSDSSRSVQITYESLKKEDVYSCGSNNPIAENTFMTQKLTKIYAYVE